MAYNIDENILYIFTDWASRPWLWKIPKKVGWMWIFFVYINEDFEEVYEDMSDGVAYLWSTNNDMELQAPINWLKLIKNYHNLDNFKKIMIVTDSRFVCNNVNNAKYGVWDRNKWNTIYWDPVIHKKQRRELVKHIKEISDLYHIKVEFDWVKWHGDDENNKRADKSAVKGTQSINKIKWSDTSVRKKFFKNTRRHKQCYISHTNADIYIHIYTARPIRKWRFRYNYEVVSCDSEYFMNTGRLFYDKWTLSAEYIYLVRLADDGSHKIIDLISKESNNEAMQKILSNWYSNDIFFWKAIDKR